MPRRNKGAALFELLFRDKGRSTNPGGSLKLPSWFHAKQPAAPAPTTPPPPSTIVPESTTASEGSATPSASPAATTKPSPASPADSPRVTPVATPTTTSPASVSPTARSAPAAKTPGVMSLRPAVQASRDAAASAPPARPAAVATPKLVPPWATGPWLSVENGRVRIDVTNFAGLVTLGVAALVVLMAFIIGRVTVRPAAALPASPAATPAPVATINDTLRRPPNPTVARGVPTPAPTPAATPPAASPAPTPPPPVAGALPAGKYYVIVADFGKKQALADKIKDYLVQKGLDARAQADSDGRLTVRVGLTDKVNADRLKETVKALMPQMVKDVPGVLRYDPEDPHCQPYCSDK